MLIRPIPAFLITLVVYIAIVNGLAMHYFWYWMYPWIDMPMHYLGGTWVAAISLWIYFFSKRDQGKKIHRSPWFVFFFGLASTLTIGLAWELFEYGLDTFVAFRTQDVVDTLSDLFFDIAGALSAIGVFIYKKYHIT